MIYDKEDITCYARMHDKMYVIGHPDIISEMQYVDGALDLRIILIHENIKRLLACAKEAGLV